MLMLLAASACGETDFALLDSVSPSIEADAGPDQRVSFGDVVHLDGSASRISPLDIWLSGGDGPNEYQLVKFRSRLGVDARDPLRTLTNQIFAHTKDFVRVRGEVYGVDSHWRQLYRLSADGGTLVPVGRKTRFRTLSALAYDERDDVLYAVDRSNMLLLIVDRDTGSMQVSPYRFPTGKVTGLAFDPERRLLVALEQRGSLLFTIDPGTGRWGSFVKLPAESGGVYDELAMHDGRLYATYRVTREGIRTTQVRWVDMQQGHVADAGPPIPEVAETSLLINDAPEPTLWSVESGPGEVIFESPRSLKSDARFSQAGEYTLELTIDASPDPVRSTMRVFVSPAN